MGSRWDRGPAWVGALPHDEEPEKAKPTDGLGDGPRYPSTLSGNELSYAGKADELFWLHPSIGRVEGIVTGGERARGITT